MQFTKEWLEQDMTGLSDRVKRVLLMEDSYRLPNLSQIIPADMAPAVGDTVTIYRGVPQSVKSPKIRAGDWVSLSHDYAKLHGQQSGASRILFLKVPASDVSWAGTDLNEFFYTPKHLYRLDGESVVDALNRIGRDAFDGVDVPLRISPEVLKMAISHFQLDLYDIHGVSHWSRVKLYAETIAREEGADLDVVRHFAFLHDVERHDDGADHEHGYRAVDFVLENASRFELSGHQIELLCEAIAGHSDGRVSNDPTVGACWDADRLDLMRLGIEPDPNLLSTTAGRSSALWSLADRQTSSWRKKFLMRTLEADFNPYRRFDR